MGYEDSGSLMGASAIRLSISAAVLVAARDAGPKPRGGLCEVAGPNGVLVMAETGKASPHPLAPIVDEQVRDVFKRIGTLKAEAIAKKIEYLLNHDDWRANVEGIKLRARIAGDYAAEEVKVTPQRPEDLGGMDDILSQLPEAMLLAIATRTRIRGEIEE